MHVCMLSLQSCLTLCDRMDCSPPGSSVHGNVLGTNTGVDCHFLLQGNLTQGLNPHLLYWQADSLPLCHLGGLFPHTDLKNCLDCQMKLNTYECKRFKNTEVQGL